MYRLLLLSIPALFVALSLSPDLLVRLQTLLEKPTVHCYGSITTVDSSNHIFTPGCLAVSKNGVFTSVFQSALAEAEMRRRGWSLNLASHVIPGLWDGHAHLLAYGEMLSSVNVFSTTSLSEITSRVLAYHRAHPGSGTREDWIKGMGWDQSLLPGGMPDAADLPEDLYILLHRTDLHCMWISPPVLALLPDPLPPAPEGGSIPTPGVFCDNAINLLLPFIPSATREQKRGFVKAAQESLHTFGIVGLHDAGVVVEDRELYQELAETGELGIRVYAIVECTLRNSFCPDEATMLARDDGMLTVRAVKLFADGALGSWGAALLEPYSDDPRTNGSMTLPPHELAAVTKQWADMGWQVCIHAIGDAATRAALDAISAASPSPAGFRIEHAQIIHPKDQARMTELGVVPSIQPTHATSDQFYALDRLGEARLRESAYRMKSLLPLGLVLGSDFPVEPPAVLRGVYAAVTRRDPGSGRSVGGEEGWYPEEKLSVPEALRGFTGNVARSARMEGRVGVVSGGAWADWVVIGRGMVADEEGGWEWLRDESIVRETWIRGRRVFLRE